MVTENAGSLAYYAKITCIHAVSGFLSGHAVKYLGRIISNQTMSTVNPLAWTTGMVILPTLSVMTYKIFTKVLRHQNEEIRILSEIVALPATYYILLGLRITLSPRDAFIGLATNKIILLIRNCYIFFMGGGTINKS